MSAIFIKNLTFYYPGQADAVFENLNLTLDTDWKLALIGRNGRGKTTLLHLLAGKTGSYSGNITARETFEYFPFALPEAPDSLSALYCAVPDLRLWALKKEMNALHLREDVLDRPLQTLSGGEKTKLLLAALFSKEEAFLLIDEPTNHLDEIGRRLVGTYLRSKRGFILVSHDRAFLDLCCDHVLALNRSGTQLRSGSFSDWQRDKAASDAAEAAKNERLKKEISALQASAERAGRWADKVEASKNQTVAGLRPDKGHIGAMAAKMAKRAKVLEKRSEKAAKEKRLLLKNTEFYGDLKLSPIRFRAETLCSVSHVYAGYGNGDAVRDFTLSVHRGERIALKGENGSGKSSVLKIFAGKLPVRAGIAAIPNDLIVSYLPQDVRSISGTIAEYSENNGASPSLVMTILNKLDFRSDSFGKDLSAFSDGQKKKVALAASLAVPAHLYIWDEPLNYIDLVSRMLLEELIARFCPTILFVEHDAAFCANVATKTVCL